MRTLHGTRLRVLAAGLIVIGAMSLSACKEVEEESARAGYAASKIEAVKGKSDDLQRITFTKEGAARTDVKTAKVRRGGEHKVIPYEALIYNDEAKTFVYTSPKPLVVRAGSRSRSTGSRANVCSCQRGRAVGTKVVTVGATEVYGAELDIAGSH